MPTVTYRPAHGAPLTQEQAERYGSRIEELKAHKGYIVPEDLVQDAKPESSPLHDFFEWDDKKAASKYRKRQAGNLLRWVHVVVRVDKEEEQTARAFYPVVTVPKHRGDGYVSLKQVLDDVDYHEKVVKEAFAKLKSWRRIHNAYKEFEPVYDAMDLVEDQIS